MRSSLISYENKSLRVSRRLNRQPLGEYSVRVTSCCETGRRIPARYTLSSARFSCVVDSQPRNGAKSSDIKMLSYPFCFISMPSIRDPDRYLWSKLSTPCRNKGKYQVSLSSFHEFQQVTEKKARQYGRGDCWCLRLLWVLKIPTPIFPFLFNPRAHRAGYARVYASMRTTCSFFLWKVRGVARGSHFLGVLC